MATSAMKSLLTLVFLAAQGLAAQEQLAYDPPPGWTRTQDPQTRLVSLLPPGLTAPSLALITVFTPESFAGSGQQFHDEILRRATSNARLLEPPQRGSIGAFLVTNLHQGMPNGLELWSRIYTARWADRGQPFILAANQSALLSRFTPAADLMMSRIAVPGMVAAASQSREQGQSANAQSAGAPGGGSGFGDYIYLAPEGWTATPAGNGLWVASPPLDAGERCTIGLWPMAPASGDLFQDAQRAWTQIFNGFVIRPEDPLNKTVLVRGVAPQGWEYALIRRGILLPQNPDAQLGGFVMAARVGDRVALVSFLSKDPRLSACYQYGYEFHPEVWPRFFASLAFRNWTAARTDLARRIQGSWESFGTSTGGGAALQYAFTPAGRYAFFGVGQRYMALSRFEAAVWTSTTFGDGSYVLKGGELTLRPDHGDPDVFFIRLEQVSDDGGRTWTEKLFMMQPTRSVTLDGSVIHDNEVGFERRQQ